MNTVIACLATLLLASPAFAAIVDLRPPLPRDLELFATSGPGPINPGVLVGFNPQPDPPGDVARADLGDPLHPFIAQPGAGLFSILIGLHPLGGVPFSFLAPTAAPRNVDGHARVDVLAFGDGSVFKAFGDGSVRAAFGDGSVFKGFGDGSVLGGFGDGSVFEISFDIAGYAGSWASFNPQPDPPGFGASFVGFSFAGDPMVTWSVQAFTRLSGIETSDGLLSFSAVPEPSALGLFALAGGALGWMRRRCHLLRSR